MNFAIAIVVLAAGTYLLRLSGSIFGNRTALSERGKDILSATIAALLFALVALSTLVESHEFAGWARVVGVAAGGGLALRGFGFMTVVVTAAAVTAGLRLLGVS
ncbi:AzlD domain-containing protein [Mitsuaria sp. WAJ17]|uniref:AzlD domain-containing protein n=1 Tax=Mitsuaria sp. WAJ17 TaxID=2761452 RepID=UPI001600A6EA|nr:AzlD domain-containing protein [Mitsuaria sp. WAJ17]MBB2485691.1 AzlD domain-containing protein [Mitsuaria sp. WAJ17]